MLKPLVKFLAKVLPDHCPTEKYFGFTICQLNPLYDQVIKEKLRMKGYE